MSNQPNARNDPLPGPAQQARQARRLQEHIAQLQAQPDDPDDPLAAERRAFFEELRRGLVDPPPAGDPNWPPLPPMGPTRVDQPEEATQAERHTARERSATPYPESPSSNHEEEVQDSLVRRRAWGSDRQGDQIPRAESPFTFQPFSSNAETSPSASQQISSESTASSATSPVMPVLPSAAVSMRRSASNDFGIESIADSDFENAPLNAPLVLPAPAPNAARNRNHRHGLRDGDDTDTEDEDMWDVAAVPRPADAAARAGLENDPVLFDGDENPDDLFFEADMHGILEAVGIQGPIIALLQNVALVSLLIACLLVVAVWIPLMTGKTIAAVSYITLTEHSYGSRKLTNLLDQRTQDRPSASQCCPTIHRSPRGSVHQSGFTTQVCSHAFHPITIDRFLRKDSQTLHQTFTVRKLLWTA